MHPLVKWPLVLIFLLQSLVCSVADESVTATQTRLASINNKIKTLNNSLTHIQNKKGSLHNELSVIEQQLRDRLHQLDALQKKTALNEEKHKLLQKKSNSLQRKINKKQQLLATHLRTRYQISSYQPLKWLLNQEDPYRMNRLLTYYHYLIQSNQQVLLQLHTLQKDQLQAQHQLQQEVAENRALQQELSQLQQQLQQQKASQLALVTALDKQIKAHESQLSHYEENKKNLSQVLASLTTKPSIFQSAPFKKMYKKLPHPVQTQPGNIQKRYQGMTFFAEEGAAVTAVYPGTVVFSDWLKGYGLLLIIDHGQGYMTLYAHNQSLLKRTGQTVKQEELIARVGHSGSLQQNGLYFEIRLHGKAISSSRWFA